MLRHTVCFSSALQILFQHRTNSSFLIVLARCYCDDGNFSFIRHALLETCRKDSSIKNFLLSSTYLPLINERIKGSYVSRLAYNLIFLSLVLGIPSKFKRTASILLYMRLYWKRVSSRWWLNPEINGRILRTRWNFIGSSQTISTYIHEDSPNTSI